MGAFTILGQRIWTFYPISVKYNRMISSDTGTASCQVRLAIFPDRSAHARAFSFMSDIIVTHFLFSESVENFLH